MTITENQRFCQYCQKTVKGRTDKKFCNDNCRNQFNNQLKAGQYNLVRKINHALLKNRRVLETLLPLQDEITKVSREQMLERGFNFRYCTHIYVNRNAGVYYYCYDYGYLSLQNDCCLLVKSKA